MADAAEVVVSAVGLVVERGGRVVLDGVDVVVTQGPPFAIVGTSGSGKTTLLMALAGLIRPRAGRIRIGDAPLDELAPRLRARRAGIVFQDHQLFPHMTVIQNVTLAPRLAGDTQADALAAQLLGELGLDGLEARRPHELSGGQRQRVAIARTLVLEPRVVLFDEPSAALDPRTTRDFATLLARLGERTQVIVVSHDVPFVEQCCGRGIRMESGRIVASGGLEDIAEA